MRKVTWLQTPTVLWLGGGNISPRYSMYMGLRMLGRQKYTALWNPRIIYRVHNIPPPVHITNNNNGLYSLPFYFFKIRVNNIPHQRPQVPSGFPPSDFPTKILYVFVSSPWRPIVTPIAFYVFL